MYLRETHLLRRGYLPVDVQGVIDSAYPARKGVKTMAKFSVTILFVTFAFLSGRLQSQTLQNDLYVTNGPVHSTAVSGNTLYIGGDFTAVGANSGAFAEVSTTTGQYIPALPIVGGQSGTPEVLAEVPDGSGGWYIGGTFSSVGGVAANGLAHIRSDNTVDPSFRISALPTSALALSGSTLYVGGSFTTVGDSARNNIAAINVGTGTVTSWNPDANNPVYALAVHGSVVYAGGVFGTIGDSARYGIAALDTSTGFATSWSGNTAGWQGQEVEAIVATGSAIYVGGDFPRMGDSTRYYIAALDPSTGRATSWNPGSNGPIQSLAVSGSIVYAGGIFSIIGGKYRNGIAALDASSGLATAWNPGQNWNTAGTGSVNTTVLALAVYGSVVYAGGNIPVGSSSLQLVALDASTGSTLSWTPNPYGVVRCLSATSSAVYVGGFISMMNTEVRNYLAAIDLSTGVVTSWDPKANNNVEAILLSGAKVYVGGNFTSINGVTRNSVAALDTVTGAPASWNPNVFGGVYALAQSGSVVYLSGSFTLVNAQQRNYIAAVDSSTGLPTPWNPNADSYVWSIVADGPEVYAGGDFFNIGDSTRHRIAELDSSTGLATSWDPNANNTVRVISKSGSLMYVGGSFTSVGDSARNNIAALNLSDGLATSWNPNASSFVYAFAPATNAVYVGGDFTRVGGQTRNHVAAIDPSTGLAESWTPNADNDVESISSSNRDSSIYFGGQFADVSGQIRPFLAGVTGSSSSVPGAPVLLAPASGDTLSGKTSALLWGSSSNANSYELQISEDAAFTSIVVDTAGLTDTLFVPHSLSSNSKYYWRVRAANGNGTSLFSAAWYFFVFSPSTQLTVVSSFPANKSMNVSTQTTLSITFSAPLDTTVHLEGGVPFFMLTNIDSIGPATWSNGLRTLSVRANLQPNTVYTAAIVAAYGQGGLRLQSPYIVRFTTGSQFPPDSVSGMVLSGATGVSPDSAIVGLVMVPDLEHPTSIPPLVAIATTDSSGDFVIPDVPNGTYYPVAAKDVDGDGIINPLTGKDVIAVGTPIVVNNVNVTGVVLTWTSFTPISWKQGLSISDSLFLSLPPRSQTRFISGLDVDTSGNSLEWVTGVTNSITKSGFLVAAGGVSTVLPMDSTLYDSLSAFTAFAPDTAANAGIFVGNAENAGGRAFLQQEVSEGDSVYILLYLGELKRTQFGLLAPDSGLYWGAQYVALNPKTLIPVSSEMFIGVFRTGAILVATGVKDEMQALPKSLALEQNYPNPFNPTTVISYQLSAVSNVTLKVYDILGRLVTTLVSEKQSAGSYSVTFDGSRLASGVYFYRLTAGSYTAIKKLVLLK